VQQDPIFRRIPGFCGTHMTEVLAFKNDPPNCLFFVELKPSLYHMSYLEIFGPRNFAKFSAMFSMLYVTDVHLNTSEFDVPITMVARSKA
jgi:hypothetical protein